MGSHSKTKYELRIFPQIVPAGSENPEQNSLKVQHKALGQSAELLFYFPPSLALSPSFISGIVPSK